MLETEKQNNEVIFARYVAPLVKKPQMAMILGCSKRTVENYMAQGMPHQKPSPRKVTFDSEQALKWYKEQYGLQRRKNLSKN